MVLYIPARNNFLPTESGIYKMPPILYKIITELFTEHITYTCKINLTLTNMYEQANITQINGKTYCTSYMIRHTYI